VQRKVSTPDSIGGETISYTTRCRLNADVRPIAGRELLLAQQFAPTAQIAFIIRYREDIQLTDRVIWKSEPFDIQYLMEMGRNVGMKILAKRPGGEASAEG
jgi:SPP1 family predicted phage head-tail adaptor